MKKILQQSDIKLEMPFYAADGTQVDPSAYNFTLEFYTYMNGVKVTASHLQGVFENCSVEDGKLVVRLDKPNFRTGELKCIMHLHYPDEQFPDKIYNAVSSVDTQIEIV